MQQIFNSDWRLQNDSPNGVNEIEWNKGFKKADVRWIVLGPGSWPDEAVTPLGQLPFFIDFLKQADVRSICQARFRSWH